MIFRAAMVVLLTAVGGTRSYGQDTSSVASMDSLLARLRALESSVEVLQKQLAEQSQSAVQTRGRVQLELTGRVVMNTFANERIVNNVDDPQFVRPDSAASIPLRGMGMAVRQTMLGVRTTVSDVLGASFRGVMDVDFYGGQQPSSGGRTFPLLRVRTAFATLSWTHGELLAGQEIPLFSPQNPVSPAAFGTPDFVGAGNLWLWLPQIRGTIQTGSNVKIALQAAVLAPTSGDPVGSFDTDFDAAERTSRPYLESRVRLSWGELEKAGELGCAAHVGWVAAGVSRAVPDSQFTAKAFGCDARIPITSWLEVRGEAYTGRLVRGLGGGAIGQGVVLSGQPVRNSAGWMQINVKPLGSMWSGGAGCGVDNPRDIDLGNAAGARLENDVCAAYAIIRPTGPVFVGGEVRRLSTAYHSGRFTNHHVNLAVGFEF